MSDEFCELCRDKISSLSKKSLIVIASEPKGTVVGQGEGGVINLLMHEKCADAVKNTAEMTADVNRKLIKAQERNGLLL